MTFSGCFRLCSKTQKRSKINAFWRFCHFSSLFQWHSWKWLNVWLDFYYMPHSHILGCLEMGCAHMRSKKFQEHQNIHVITEPSMVTSHQNRMKLWRPLKPDPHRMQIPQGLQRTIFAPCKMWEKEGPWLERTCSGTLRGECLSAHMALLQERAEERGDVRSTFPRSTCSFIG